MAGSALVDRGGPFVWLDPDAGADGPLSLLDVAVKDLIAIAGHPTSAGTSFHRWPAATTDAAIVAELRRAGARILGATALHELACGVTGVNRSQGTVANPGAPGRIPGGSSSGSAAAVASGLADVAVGTDTGGSVRIPSACCGVIGYKPPRGALPLDGIVPCAPTLDHVGLHARTVKTIEQVMEVLTGRRSDRPSDLCIGVAASELAAATVAVRKPVAAAIARLSRAAVPVELPAGALVADVTTSVLLYEFAQVNADLTDEQRDRLGYDIRGRLEAGEAISEPAYRSALGQLEEIRAAVNLVLTEVDAIVVPTLPIVPPTIEAAAADPIATARALVRFTRLANASGHAAISVPLPTPLPVGIQVVGSEGAVLELATELEQVTERDRPDGGP